MKSQISENNCYTGILNSRWFQAHEIINYYDIASFQRYSIFSTVFAHSIK